MRQVTRQEKKFLVDPVSAAKLRRRLSAVMHEDEHNGACGYRVRSLYFDTLHDRDFVEKLFGTDPRRKVRLRLYDPAGDFALLECKQKQGENQLKRSMPLNRSEAMKLIAGDAEWMLDRKEPFAAEMYAFIKTNGYRPKSIVEYRRQAFIAKENRIRITFDTDIRSTESNVNVFDENLSTHPVLDPFNVILEVKYNGFLMSYIKDELNSVSKRPISVSKYCLGRDITMGFQF
ncbi:polyphosphate polymerase domain-containing protein [Collinsella tanakaei]|nr:polyphosphate polymerase domain-containing protein [Collinsella tanakaei]